MEKSMFYTYELIDPRNNKVFYVGKGKDKRMYSHYFAAKSGKDLINTKLGNKLKKLIKENLKPIYKKVLETNNEQEAFNKEVELIAKYGRENLCNLTDGGEGVSGGCYPNFAGHHHTEKSKKKIGNGVKNSETYQKGIANRDFTGKNNPMYGRSRKGEKGLGDGKKAWKTRRKNGNDKFTKEHLKNMSIAQKNRPKLKCPHCHKILDPRNALRWHFENCKEK